MVKTVLWRKCQDGNNVKIQNNVSIYDGVVIEDDVFIGPSVVFTNVKFPRSNSPVNKNYDKTVIKRGVSIGANSTIVYELSYMRIRLLGRLCCHKRFRS